MTFSETADIETSSAAYAARFAGPAGEWMLGVQEQAVMDLLGQCAGLRIFEPAGGHAQLAPGLLSAGARVTVMGSSAECGQRLAAFAACPDFKFEVGDLVKFPYPDRSFDAVVSVRFLSHCTRWPQFIAEVCRVANDCVVLDYPPRMSFNILAGALFSLKKRLEGNTRQYAIFSDKEIEEVFLVNGFVPERRTAQFFFPMVVHRMLKRPLFSAALEKAAALLGLRALFGSPVLVKMVRRKD